MNKNKLMLLIYTSLMTAIVAVVTMAIPLPSPVGFYNIGDSMVMLSALLLGPIGGFFAGGLGSALADFLLGWGTWAPWSLVIKGLEGYIIGKIAYNSYQKADGHTWLVKFVLSALIGVAVMVAGYWFAAGVMAGNFTAAAVEVPGNTIQGCISIVIAALLATALKNKLFKKK